MKSLSKINPFIALLLSFITPGLGQIFNGQLKRGIILYVVLFLLSVVLGFSGLFFKFYGMVFSLLILVLFFLFVLTDAVIGAFKFKETKSKLYNKWYLYVIIVLISNFAIQPLVSYTRKNYVARAYQIPSSAMEPTLLVGDHLIANMRIYKKEEPKRGDIVIFQFPNDPSKDFIKRVIGLEGEKVEMVRDKIYINDTVLDDPWGYYDSLERTNNFGPIVVPENSLFVLGDNRNNSQDSRYWGYVTINKLKGKALYIYWAKNKKRIGGAIK